MTDLRNQAQSAELRRQAEGRLARLNEQSVPNVEPKNVEALTHELRVHQIELEMQNHELRRAQEQLEASRNTYQELYESLPVGYVTMNRDSRMYDMNPAGKALLRWNPKPLQPWIFNMFFSDKDCDRFILFCRDVASLQTSDTDEFEMKRSDGSVFFAAVQADPVKTGQDTVERLRITFEDVTRRREVEEILHRQRLELEASRTELRELAGKLFAAQEAERKRIARDLHDDYCQRVTALILEANMLRKGCEKEALHLAPRLTAMSQTLSDILCDFRALSHELLPRNLDDTSLAVPIRNLVNEFNEKAGFETRFFEQEVSINIPSDTMTTLFRVVQESLCNIVKHAQAKHVAVTLGETEQGEVELVVTDDGIGFDTTRAWSGQNGLGLVGMRERMRQVGGTVKIVSEPGQGTTVVLSVPRSVLK